ncbi:MAG: helix-turn-helix transcriptional regulator [Lachnospiraceae bacterium]|nr:helix-turn-helix transcriptional regulator [Lachnospiraceae bacterium]
MNYAYEERLVDNAMENMGEMVEYWMEGCNQDPRKLFHILQISGIAEEWEHGNIAFILGRSGTELCQLACERIGMNRKEWPDALERFDTDYTYWMGWILAYFQWRTGMTFRDILEDMSFEQLERYYPTMHTVSEERCAEEFLEYIHSKRKVRRLQMYRKRLGLSQRELAEASGVNIRTIQQYETGAKDINKAAVQNVVAMARALHCDVEDLMEL